MICYILTSFVNLYYCIDIRLLFSQDANQFTNLKKSGSEIMAKRTQNCFLRIVRIIYLLTLVSFFRFLIIDHIKPLYFSI